MKLPHIALSTVLLLGAASISFTQTQPGGLVADIPFAFVVAERTLPPGRYVVNSLNERLSIHDDKNACVFAAAHSAQRPARENATKLVFHRYGNIYFLSEVWVGDNSIGRALYPSRAERELREHGRETELAVVRMGK